VIGMARAGALIGSVCSVSRRCLSSSLDTILERVKPLGIAASVFPAEAVAPDAPQANGRVGHDFEASLPPAVAERKIVR
jgi:hypothetical protein